MGEEGKPGGYGENVGKPGEHTEGIPGQSHTYTQQAEKAGEKYGETDKEMGKGPEGHKAPGMHPGGQSMQSGSPMKTESEGGYFDPAKDTDKKDVGGTTGTGKKETK